MHMGKKLQDIHEFENVAYNIFENGIIVLNDNTVDKTVTIKLPPEFNYSKLVDLYNENRTLDIVNRQIRITAPAKKARIYSVK